MNALLYIWYVAMRACVWLLPVAAVVAVVLALSGCGWAAFVDHTCDGQFNARCERVR